MKPGSVIVFISNYAKNSQGGGIQTFVENLFDSLSDINPHVFLIARYGKPTTENEKVIAGSKFVFIRRSYFTCLRLRPTVIHSHANWYCIVPAILYGLTRRVKIVHTMHSLPEKKYKWHIKLFFSWILARCDNVNFVSFFLRSHFEEVQGIHCRKSSVIYPGSDHVSKGPSLQGQEAFRTQFGIDNDAIIILAHGLTAHALKFQGAMMLMEAFARLLVEFPKLVLVLTKKGRFLEALQKRASQLCLDDSVVFTFDLQNAAIANEVAQIYAHITLGEGGVSIAILEAMAIGNPVVATRIGGIPELLKDTVNALLIEPSVDAVYTALKTLMENPELRKSVSSSAQELVKARYTWKSTSAQFIELYEMV